MNRSGFTLVEMLMVVAVIGITATMILGTPRADDREARVKAAADELASVLRATRTQAMERRGLFAVSFNIANQPGSSGRVLNNRGGGHWYRVLGPRDETAGNLTMPGTGYPPMYSRDVSSLNGYSIRWNLATIDSPVRHLLEAVDRAWIGDRRQLPVGKVRFVALTDQDNGNYRENGDTYPPTYPRPWFGWWEQASGRLHAWGGYDPALAMTSQTGPSANNHKPRSLAGRTISHSGFHYEGYDGAITGCTNPSDRLLYDDTDNNGVVNSGETTRYPLWRSGEPRPLINARWEDCMILFRPDGSATASWMSLRHECANGYATSGNLFYDPCLTNTGLLLPADMPGGKRHMMELGPGDMCNRMSNASGAAAEGSWSASRSGHYYITLGPDAVTDNDSFPNATVALRSLMPLYRVGVSPFGEVIVRRVRTSPRPGEVFDTVLSGTDWNVKAKTDLNYRDHQLVNKVTVPVVKYTRRGRPITDLLTPEMLSGRIWWFQ